MPKQRTSDEDALSKKERFLFAILMLLFIIQCLWHAKDKSAVYDEPAHLTTSYLPLKTGHWEYDFAHPPLIRTLLAVPMLRINPSLPSEIALPTVSSSIPLAQHPGNALYTYSTSFLYGNRISADRMIFWARGINILLSCLLGIWIFKWSRALYGSKAGLLSLGLFSFCPNSIAHSSLATTDMGGVTFAVGFLYSFYRLLEKDKIGQILSAGILLGCALLSKLTNIFLVPLFVCSYPFLCAAPPTLPAKSHKTHRDTTTQTPLPYKNYLQSFKRAGIVLCIAWLVLSAGYQFKNIFTAHSLQEEDWKNLGYPQTIQTLYRYIPLPDSFLKGICYSRWHAKRGHGSYLLGNYSSEGWWYYFPIAFLLKTPTATLILLSGWLFFIAKKRIVLMRNEALLLLPIALLLSASMNSKVNIGLRHILLCYPLLYVLLGKMIQCRSLETAKNNWIMALFCLFLAAELFSVSPHYLAFFNRAAGGPLKGIQYLSDSNIDWGQDLKKLAQLLKKEGDPEVILSYFGTAPPEYYGIKYQSLPTVWSFPKSEHVNSIRPKKEYLAVSVTNLQGTYFTKHDLYGWLQSKKPIARIGYSIYLYDVTNDLESQERLLEIYRMTGELNKFLRQVTRVKKLSG